MPRKKPPRSPPEASAESGQKGGQLRLPRLRIPHDVKEAKAASESLGIHFGAGLFHSKVELSEEDIVEIEKLFSWGVRALWRIDQSEKNGGRETDEDEEDLIWLGSEEELKEDSRGNTSGNAGSSSSSSSVLGSSSSGDNPGKIN
jgi:hypothetical protein